MESKRVPPHSRLKFIQYFFAPPAPTVSAISKKGESLADGLALPH